MAYSNILWKAQTLQTEFVHLQVSKLKKNSKQQQQQQLQTTTNQQDIF